MVDRIMAESIVVAEDCDELVKDHQPSRHPGNVEHRDLEQPCVVLNSL